MFHEPTSDDPTSDDLLSALESVAVRYRTQYMADLATINVTPSEAAVLLLLGAWPEVKWPDQKTIREKLPGSAPPSRAIRELYNRDLISMDEDDEDGRRWLHKLTPKGRRLVSKIKAIREVYSDQLRSAIRPAGAFAGMYKGITGFDRWLAKRQ
jgi:DNA-binding MarR family transcriptional regulator